MMTVIAMTREMGSLGKDVAILLAERLGLEIIHHELVENDLARQAHLGPSEVHRFLEGGREGFFKRQRRSDTARLSRLTRIEVLELARRGNVIIRGWGATYLLRSIPQIPCVRVCAPMSLRVERMMERLGFSDAELAEQEIVANDAAHDRVMRGLFAADWLDPSHYDLVLSTERMTIEECTDQIEYLARQKRFVDSDVAEQALDEALLEARIKSAIADSAPHHGDSRLINAQVMDGRVVLSGGVMHRASLDAALQAVRGLSGPRMIDNQLWCSDQFARD